MALRFYLDEHGDEVLEVTPDEFDGVPPMTEHQDLTKSERAQIVEILNRRAQVVPQGWKLVPVEPTSEMIDAAWKHGIDDEAPDPYYAYKAMLSAAPQPPEGCTACGIAGIHACTGAPIQPVSESKHAELCKVMGEIFPEAAPVQMPEPVEYQARMRPTWDSKHPWTEWAKCSPEAAADYERVPLLHDWAYEVRKLYTEHQVRQLLAAHGVK